MLPATNGIGVQVSDKQMPCTPAPLTVGPWHGMWCGVVWCGGEAGGPKRKKSCRRSSAHKVSTRLPFSPPDAYPALKITISSANCAALIHACYNSACHFNTGSNAGTSGPPALNTPVLVLLCSPFWQSLNAVLPPTAPRYHLYQAPLRHA